MDAERIVAAIPPHAALGEPSASLIPASRAVFMALTAKARSAANAVVGTFHAEKVRNRVADRLFEGQPPSAAA